MKGYLLISMLFLSLAASLAAETIDEISIDRSALHFDQASRTVFLDGTATITHENQPVLPIITRQYYSDGTISNSPMVQVVAADTLELPFTPSLSPADITTSLESRVVPRTFADHSQSLYPSKAAEIETMIVNSAAVRAVTFYPIQYLDDNRIIFNYEFTVNTDDPFSRISAGMPKPAIDKPVSQQQALGAAPGLPLGSEYVVVTSTDLAPAFDDFVALKRRTGFAIDIALIDTIIASYTGIDDAEALRNYLIDFHNNGGRYVLLGGDDTILPVRYAYYYNTGLMPELYNLAVCDLYFADVNGTWDIDGDNIWGEPTQDQPDIGMDLWVGRLPFARSEQIAAYTRKLEAYLFNPGNGDRSYLTHSLYFSSDHLRDYVEGGQQYSVAEEFPGHIISDCEGLAEQTNGADPAPSGPTVDDTRSTVSQGAGFVNVLAHGRPDGFALKTSGYNEQPKTYILTANGNGVHAEFNQLTKNNKVGFYYSIACDQGMFDVEAVHGFGAISTVEGILEADSSGAIGIIAFSRWGWVSSSYKLMASFYRNLFDSADGYPLDAMQRSMLEFPYYRDQIYGQNYYGDPSLRLYTAQPSQAAISGPSNYTPGEQVSFQVRIDGQSQLGVPVTATTGTEIIASGYTDIDGVARLDIPEGMRENIIITACNAGTVGATQLLTPGIIADADDDDAPLPLQFALEQNYPNPFNPSTIIRYSLPKASEIKLVVYDILGRVVRVLEDSYQQAGTHAIYWDGSSSDGQPVASGIYFYRLNAGDRTATNKMVLLK